MSSFYNVLTTLQPTAGDQQGAEAFAQQYLSGLYPDYDFREGTALYDTVIRPTGSMVSLMKAAINFYFTNYTLQGANDNTPSDFVDAILSNWFSTRQQGSNAIINVNLNFASQVPVTLTTGQVFSPDGQTTFSPIQSAVYPADLLTYDPSTQEWVLNVNLQATGTGTQYNISTGSLLYFTNFNPFFLGGTINYLVSPGYDTETNTQFIQRTQSEISTRNLINRLSIESFLANTFPSLGAVATEGYGDAPMQRDTVTVYSVPLSGTVEFHMGGYVDVYAASPVASSYTTVVLDDNGNGTVSGPIYAVANVGQLAGTSVTLPASAAFTTSFPGSIDPSGNSIPSGDVLFSSQEIVQVSFGPSASGQTAGLQTGQFQNVANYQNGIIQPSTRVLCANYLVKAPSTFFVDLTLTTSQVAPTANVLQVCQNYATGLGLGENFVMADLLLQIQAAGVVLDQTYAQFTYCGTDGTTASGTFYDYYPKSTQAVSTQTQPASGPVVPPAGLFQWIVQNATVKVL